MNQKILLTLVTLCCGVFACVNRNNDVWIKVDCAKSYPNIPEFTPGTSDLDEKDAKHQASYYIQQVYCNKKNVHNFFSEASQLQVNDFSDEYRYLSFTQGYFRNPSGLWVEIKNKENILFCFYTKVSKCKSNCRCQPK